jgi:GTPase SAR1 family protein
MQFELTADQEKALIEINKWYNSPPSKKALLYGQAGVGKTSVVATFIKNLIKTKDKTKVKICVVAPTHKALKVIKNMCEKNEIIEDLHFNTIHSLLGLRQVIDGYGNQSFKRENGSSGKDKSSEYNLIICDEASMIGSELLSYIKNDIKILFVGDNFQLNPVNEIDSPVFNLDIPKFGLTEIVRQVKENKIIEFSKSIREKGGISDIRSYLGTNDLILMPMKRFQAGIPDVFNSENYKKNIDYGRILCYTNKEVSKWNQYIRNKIFPNSNRQIDVGERIIFRKPALNINFNSSKKKSTLQNRFSFDTNDEVTIIDVEEKIFKFKNFSLDTYVCEGLDENTGKSGKFRILNNNSTDEYNDILSNLKRQALSKKQGTKEAKNAWVCYYEFSDLFAVIQGAYACTVHVSQGSTFENCFVILSDFDNCRVNLEKIRLFYTAVTRASEKVVMITA